MSTFALTDSQIQLSEASVARRHQQSQRRSREFLRGPVPINWLAHAARQGKLAQAAGILVWFRYGCLQTRHGDKLNLTVSANQYERFGLSATTFSRGLRKLEAAGLITVSRSPGRKPQISIVSDFEDKP